MSLSLPPKSVIRCDEQTAQDAYQQLTSFIAGHAQATTTYRFYEEIDNWLGPWGQTGYPIAYGKFYNKIFTTSYTLMSNTATKQWVERTTILLQEVLRDYIINRIRDCTITTLTEQQLRKVAFDSHPQVYDSAGLATVVLIAPELLLIISTIPIAEFNPMSENFFPTLKQIFFTLGLVVPRVMGGVLATFAAGPAHTGLLSRAVRQDRQRSLNQAAISKELGRLKYLINHKKLDHIPWLNQIITRLNARQFPNQGFSRLAREAIQAAKARKRQLLQKYNDMLEQSPEIRDRINLDFPNVLDSCR